MTSKILGLIGVGLATILFFTASVKADKPEPKCVTVSDAMARVNSFGTKKLKYLTGNVIGGVLYTDYVFTLPIKDAEVRITTSVDASEWNDNVRETTQEIMVWIDYGPKPKYHWTRIIANGPVPVPTECFKEEVSKP